MQTTAISPKTALSGSDIGLSQDLPLEEGNLLSVPESPHCYESSARCVGIIFSSFLAQIFPHQGLLLLDEAGKLMHSTPKAREICQALQSDCRLDDREGAGTWLSVRLPHQITKHHTLLVDSRREFPEQSFQLYEDVDLETGERINIQAEWISLDGQGSPCLLVRLENITQTAHQRARCDAQRYGLTHREQEVWALHLQDLSYQEVSDQLFITKDTVRKHMKSIYSKRRDREGKGASKE